VATDNVSHLTMERLFLPCSRLHGILESQGWVRRHPELFQERNLNVSTEELLSAERGFTYADSYAMLGNGETVVWLTPHAAVARNGGRAMRHWNYREETTCSFCFSADGKNIVALASTPPSIYWRFAILFFDCWQ
jgi:hypothetical protein